MDQDIISACPGTDSMKLYASQAGSGGGNKEETPMEKKVKGEDTPVDQTGQESANRNNGSEPSDKSITQPDTDLTGDTGNLNKGQTDLGASGTGAEDL